jgi:hypothetical protein
MITPSGRHKHPSSSANRPSDVGVTVYINAGYNLMAVDSIIEFFSRDLVTEYCQGLESSAVYTAPLYVVNFLPGHSNRSLPRLPLLSDAEAMIPTLLTLNIYIGLCPPNSLSLIQLWSYEMFEILPIVRINKTVSLWEIRIFCLQKDTFRYWLATGIPLNEAAP